jgi:hypothetical protein
MNALMSTVEIVISRSKITVKSSCLSFHDFHAAADQQEQSPHWKMIYDDSSLINENEDTLAEQAILSSSGPSGHVLPHSLTKNSR